MPRLRRGGWHPARAAGSARVRPAVPIAPATVSTLQPTAPPRRFLIRGLTLAGRSFRPSDWAERLAGAMSSFRPGGASGRAHIGYSPYCVPQVVGGVKCVLVSEALRGIEPMAWDFVMNFARDNELQVSELDAWPGPAGG